MAITWADLSAASHTRIWEHFNTLKAALVAAVDTETSAVIPLASGWVNQGDLPMTAYKAGGFVWLEGTVSRSSGTVTVIGTLPAGFRPQRERLVPAIGSNSGSARGPMFWLSIKPTGAVEVKSYTSGDPTWSSTTWILLTTTPWRVG